MITTKSMKMIEATYRDDRMLSLPRDFHSHHAYEIFLFHKGQCAYVIHDRVCQLQPGDLIVLDGKVLHRPNPYVQPYIRSVLHFSSEFMTDMLDSHGLTDLLSIFHAVNNRVLSLESRVLARVDALMKQIALLYRGAYGVYEWKIDPHETDKRKRLRSSKVKLLIAELMLEIYEYSDNISHKQKTNTQSEWEYYTEKMLLWVHQYYDGKVRLDDIAAGINLDKYHMSRVFKKVTGQTIMDYVRSCRLNRAKYLLETFPEKTILQVSEESGFESNAYFSRFFLEKTGRSPSEYRKNMQNVIQIGGKKNSG